MVSPSALPAGADSYFLAPPSASPRPEQQELRDGLLDNPAHIDPKFLYDALGSSLFTAITQLPEYYPTRCEAEIFERHGQDIARRVGPVQAMIDLGAGDCAKAERLFASLRPRHYVPIDISADYLQSAVRRLRLSYPDLRITPIGLDLSQALALPAEIAPEQRLFFYPGSSIGNLDPEAALAMLRRIRRQCVGGGLLVGVDRVKPRQVLEPAYDDALHLTAAFNLNVLRHVNRVLGSDFDVDDWHHVALFNSDRSRIEMHLQARHPVTVTWPGDARHFAPGERIHTENSYKFAPQAFADLLGRAGFNNIEHWSDSRGWFSVFSARA
ncbi:MAG: L-histidine N(alpha)-methyltransferase [Achromobacter sp.]|uniref:Histidine N-alpha-methyltransferase n=1 Tax=Achromobacter pulmonis TaxID=1389932 RepID=A0A6S7EFU5_9BURK|nr:L-histidine N(alpha)-methyltransferase [Achromobacter pulmonis]MCF7771433.1 L-histidine N(alpha)-methyltransferase [Achromobacter pulmonis]MPT27646.1 L-histidine N(alpha)-methyltransferase [Achromobacter sp.]CAB3695223.1 Histidine N-alpha-methyltransferase [Achromobacter pulmonis]CAB3910676.1 Histidine N-alpha-methyltransferase [Achromobacter pulmonis]